MVKGGQSNKSGPRYGSGYQLRSLAIQGQIVQTYTENIAGKVYNGLELKRFYMFTWKKTLQFNVYLESNS